LGAPVGSLLLGKADFIKKARRVRKVMGGGMRQAGFLAAAGIYALENNVLRLKEDHQKAKILENALLNCTWVETVVPVETNIVVAILKDANKRDAIIQEFKDLGVLIMAFGPGMLRMVTHLDITDSQLEQTLQVISKIKG
jgi:threonine aldolase